MTWGGCGERDAESAHLQQSAGQKLELQVQCQWPAVSQATDFSPTVLLAGLVRSRGRSGIPASLVTSQADGPWRTWSNVTRCPDRMLEVALYQ